MMSSAVFSDTEALSFAASFESTAVTEVALLYVAVTGRPTRR
jgi:hypothetical protein